MTLDFPASGGDKIVKFSYDCEVSDLTFSPSEQWVDAINKTSTSITISVREREDTSSDVRTANVTVKIKGTETCDGYKKSLTIVQAGGGGGSCQCTNVSYSTTSLSWPNGGTTPQSVTITPPNGCTISELDADFSGSGDDYFTTAKTTNQITVTPKNGITSSLVTDTLTISFKLTDNAQPCTKAISVSWKKVGPTPPVECICTSASFSPSELEWSFEEGRVRQERTIEVTSTSSSCELSQISLVDGGNLSHFTCTTSRNIITVVPKSGEVPVSSDFTDTLRVSYKIGDATCSGTNAKEIPLVWYREGGQENYCTCDDVTLTRTSLSWSYSDGANHEPLEVKIWSDAPYTYCRVSSVEMDELTHFDAEYDPETAIITITPKGDGPTQSDFNENLVISYTIGGTSCFGSDSRTISLTWQTEATSDACNCYDLRFAEDSILWNYDSGMQHEPKYVSYHLHDSECELSNISFNNLTNFDVEDTTVGVNKQILVTPKGGGPTDENIREILYVSYKLGDKVCSNQEAKPIYLIWGASGAGRECKCKDLVLDKDSLRWTYLEGMSHNQYTINLSHKCIIEDVTFNTLTHFKVTYINKRIEVSTIGDGPTQSNFNETLEITVKLSDGTTETTCGGNNIIEFPLTWEAYNYTPSCGSDKEFTENASLYPMNYIAACSETQSADGGPIIYQYLGSCQNYGTYTIDGTSITGQYMDTVVFYDLGYVRESDPQPITIVRILRAPFSLNSSLAGAIHITNTTDPNSYTTVESYDTTQEDKPFISKVGINGTASGNNKGAIKVITSTWLCDLLINKATRYRGYVVYNSKRYSPPQFTENELWETFVGRLDTSKCCYGILSQTNRGKE